MITDLQCYGTNAMKMHGEQWDKRVSA